MGTRDLGEAGGPGGYLPDHTLFGVDAVRRQRRARCPGLWHGRTAARSMVIALDNALIDKIGK
jgi:hypothetical protein